MKSLAPAVALSLLYGCATAPPQRPPAAARPFPSAAVGDMAAAFVADATALVGQPYRYGGAAPGGFDCSGLVQFAARQAGIEVPRTAAEQLKAGMAVGRGDLLAGDLVFMHLRGKELHVGIAMGDGRFVHAPSTGRRVRIDSLADAPYAHRFLAARRIVPADRRARNP